MSEIVPGPRRYFSLGKLLPLCFFLWLSCALSGCAAPAAGEPGDAASPPQTVAAPALWTGRAGGSVTPAVYTAYGESDRLLSEFSPKTAAMCSQTASASRVSGVFVVPRLSSEATRDQWRKALRDMKEIGIDTVIIQYCYWRDPRHGDQAYFPYEKKDTASDAGEHPSRRRQIDRILSAAALEMKVYLGLQIAEDEWFRQELYRDGRWLREQYLLSAELAGALWSAYGETYGDAIAGWYLPFEFSSSKEFQSCYRQITQAYYAPLTAELKSRYRDRKIMISPMMYMTDDIGVWTEAVELILSGARIDIFAPQDGIGYGTQTHDSVGAWFRATRQAVDAARHGGTERDIELWANCENYARLQNPEEPDPIERKKPMSIGKLIKSMDIAAPYVDKLVM